MSDAKLRNGGVVSYHQMQHHHYAMKQAAVAADCYPVPLDLSQKSSRLKANNNPVNNSNKTNQKMKSNKANYNNLINTDLKSIINELSNKKLKTTKEGQGSQFSKSDIHNSGLEMNEEMNGADDETNEQLENEIYGEYTEEASSTTDPENFSTDDNINHINYEHEECLNDEDNEEFDHVENVERTDTPSNNGQNMNQQAVHMAAAAAVALMENLINKSNSSNTNKIDAPMSELNNQELLKMSNLFKLPNFYNSIYNNNKLQQASLRRWLTRKPSMVATYAKIEK